MWNLWWPNHIVSAHVLRIAKNIACCVWKTSQDCISVYMLWWFEIWENRFNSHTIITAWWELSPSRYILWLPHLLEYTLVIIFKSIFDLFAFDFSLHIFLTSISYVGLLEREKKYPMIFDIPILLYLSTQVSLTSHFCYAETYRCHAWLAGNSDKMVINAFLSGFFSPSRKKEWYEC